MQSAETGKEVWDCLAKDIKQKTLSRKIHLRQKRYSANLAHVDVMIELINRVKTVAEHLEAIGDPITENDNTDEQFDRRI